MRIRRQQSKIKKSERWKQERQRRITQQYKCIKQSTTDETARKIQKHKYEWKWNQMSRKYFKKVKSKKSKAWQKSETIQTRKIDKQRKIGETRLTKIYENKFHINAQYWIINESRRKLNCKKYKAKTIIWQEGRIQVLKKANNRNIALSHTMPKFLQIKKSRNNHKTC